MKQSCTYSLRRHAAVGAVVAIVAASSAFGIGATAASAATTDAGPTSSAAAAGATGTGTGTGTGAGTGSTAATVGTDGSTTADGSATDGSSTATGTKTGDTGTNAGSADTNSGNTATDAGTPGDTGTDGDTATGNTGTTPGGTTGTTPETGTGATTGTGTGTTTDAQPTATTPVTWADPSSADAPIVLTTTAGQAFSHTFTAQGGDAPLTYRFTPSDRFSEWEWNERTGVLSGTPLSSSASSITLTVTATDGQQQAVQCVQLLVTPGPAVGVTYSVGSDVASSIWQVNTDGTVRQYDAGDSHLVTSIPAVAGATYTFAGLAVDAWGNPTTPSNQTTPPTGDEYPRSTVTSTNSADTASWSSTGDANEVVFTGAGTRTVTVSEGGVSTPVTVVVTDEPFGFTEQSSADAPLTLDATAGEAFTHTFATVGAPDPTGVRYSLRDDEGGPIDAEDLAWNDMTIAIDPTTGVLTGSSTRADWFDFQVVATSGGQETVVPARIDTAAAAVAGFQAAVLPDLDTVPGDESWGIADGAITHWKDGKEERVDSLRVQQGSTWSLRALPVDAFGNAVGDHDELSITSDVASDRIVYDPEQAATSISFPHASPHVVTVAYQGESLTIPFDVVPAATTAGSTTTTGSGRLAYTGADETGPLAWALGLLAAGGGLGVHRIRRRRA